MISETDIRTALVAFIRRNDERAQVHRRVRYPAQNRVEQWLKLLRDADNQFNAYMVRRVRRRPNLRGIPKRLVSIELEYEIRFYFGLKDDDDDSVASEEKAQARIDSLAALLEADTSLGLGATVSHDGLDMPGDFEDRAIGDWVFHRADMRIVIKVANVTCE